MSEPRNPEIRRPGGFPADAVAGVVLQGAAAVATGGLSIPAQLGIQAAVLVGTTLLSRQFDRKAVLAKRRKIPDPLSAEFNKNPIARHPVGPWVRDGGTIMAAFHKRNKDDSKVSTRCDVVIALAEGDLPLPTLRDKLVRYSIPNPLNTNPPTVEETISDGLLTFVNGERVVLSKQRERSVTGGSVKINYQFYRDAATDTDVRYTVRDHYEPERFSPSGKLKHAGPVHLGALRAYWNRASDADSVRWQELIAYMRVKPEWWNDTDGLYTDSEWYKAWGPDHQLTGITGIHLILNYSAGGISGSYQKSDNKKRSQVTSFPGISFEYKGLEKTRQADGSADDGMDPSSGNPAKILAYMVVDQWGFDPSILDTVAQAAAKTRCDAYTKKLTGTGGAISLKPMEVAGVLTDDEPPLRMLQMLETITGGQIAFRDNKISLVPGEHKTGTPVARHVTEADLWRAPTITSNIANNQRRNAVQGTLLACLQSKRNSPVELPLVTNQHLRAEDNNQFIERVPRIAYINNYYDAQQIMAIHNELQGTRRRLVLPIRRDPDHPDRSDWKEGSDLVVNMPSAGINNRVFIIDEFGIVPDEGFLISAYEQGDEDPYEFLSYSAFDLNPDDTDLPDIETGEVLVPLVSNVHRPTKLNKSNIDLIAFDVARIDEDYGYYLEIEYHKAGEDFVLLAIEPKNWLTYTFQLLDFNDQTITFRVRYRTTPTRAVEGPVGAWSDEFVSGPLVVSPTAVTGLTVVSIMPTDALVVWVPGEYVGHKHVELRYGTGSSPSDATLVGTAATAEGGAGAFNHKLTALTQETQYWVQVRFVNEDDEASSWADSQSTTFTTTAHVAATLPWTLPYAIPFNLTEEEVVNATLPAAGSIPAGTTITYALEGTLPSGLAFTAATRALAGTVAEGAATGTRAYILSYKAIDSSDDTRFVSSTVYVNVADDAREITFAKGDTSITTQIGTRTLEPASPQLPQATGGNGTITYKAVGLASWMRVSLTTRRVTMDPDTDVVVPTGFHPLQASFRWEATDGETTTAISIIVFAGHVPVLEEQAVYRLHNDYITGPALTQTTQDTLSDVDIPSGWSKARTAPTAANPFTWRATRTRVRAAGAWTVWGDLEVAGQYQVPQRLTQECYYLAADGSVGDLPTLANSDLNKVDEAYIPSGCSDSIPTPTADKPNAWLLKRYWSPALASATAWAYSGITARFNPIPPIPVLEEQVVYRLHTDYITGPALAQTSQGVTSDSNVPSGWSKARIAPTAANPFTWRATRTRVRASGAWTEWGDLEVAGQHQAPQRLTQECYYLAADGSVGDLPTLANSDLNKVDEAYIPAGCSDSVPTPTADKPNAWLLKRYWSSTLASATAWAYSGITARFNPIPPIPVLEEQVVYRLHTDYITGPALAQTSQGVTSDSNVPSGWSKARIAPTAANPFTWRATRTRVRASGAWTEWGDLEVAGQHQAPQRLTQECYYLAADGSVGDLPTLANSDLNKVDEAYIPAGCSDSVPTPTADKPNAWLLKRYWSSTLASATAWAYSGITARFNPAPVPAIQRLSQETFYGAADSVTDVSSTLSLSSQTEANRLALSFRPAGTQNAPPSPTAAKPNTWKLTRVWSNDATIATAWSVQGIHQIYQAPVPVPPKLPVFSIGYDSYSLVINTTASHNMPRATISGGETIEYVLSPSLPSPMIFTQSGSPAQPRITGIPRTIGGSTHALIARVASDHSRQAVCLFSLNVYNVAPNFGDQTVPSQ